MTVLQTFRYNLADLARRGKEQRIKQQLVSHIIDGLNTPYQPAISYPKVPQYRETIFNFYTRRHYISLNLMRIINAVKKEKNDKLAHEIDVVVGDFSYIPDVNSYCQPMIRLQIQSQSVLRPADEFASDSADIEINNHRMELKIVHCCELIKKYQVSDSLLDLMATVHHKPDIVFS